MDGNNLLLRVHFSKLKSSTSLSLSLSFSNTREQILWTKVKT